MHILSPFHLPFDFILPPFLISTIHLYQGLVAFSHSSHEHILPSACNLPYNCNIVEPPYFHLAFLSTTPLISSLRPALTLPISLKPNFHLLPPCGQSSLLPCFILPFYMIGLSFSSYCYSVPAIMCLFAFSSNSTLVSIFTLR